MLGRRRARAGRAWAAQGRAGLGRWARAGRHGRRVWALGVTRRQACVGGQAQVGGSNALAQRARGRARQLGAGAGGRQGAGRAAGRWVGGRALGARQAGRWARGRQALGARGLGAWAGLGQCTRCTRPIFDPF